ncbi:kinase-like domain-containing protein, partial [Crepidotus variabilis]
MSKDSTPSGHPSLGTLIDENSLKLVEVLGTGGYGVVYRAVDAYSRSPRSYAVKCLAYANDRSAARRHLHMREVALHQLASSHSSVVTLHRVVREHNCLFLVMEYATDGDLFAQILTETTYLGRDDLIKKTFLQIIDAVQHCHYLGIYHRDLKPENVLCFDRGYRVAITDFGLATTDKTSKEFRTGSVYHMSPECQSADSRSGSATYSPQHNDIWSLGIMLLNLTTGRNPWKSATPDDPTFQAYKRHPRRFLKQVLPISEELNNILEGALAVDWKKRMSLSEMATAIKRVRTF